MSFSINTNASSLSALQVLQSTQQQRQGNQTAINTGLKVATAKDNAATFSIAQSIRSQIASHSALFGALERKVGLLDVTLNGVDMIYDTLIEMNELAVAAADPGIDQESRDALQEDFEAHKKLIDIIASNSEIFGHNLLDSRDSNFLSYGADKAKIGSTDRTHWEPQPGEDIDLSFSYVGSGKNDEEVDGDVSFYWRTSSDGGASWDAPQLIETVTIPSHQIVDKNGTPYTVNISSPFVTPQVAGANAYEIYAEWVGHWPGGDDGIAFSDTLANGTEHKIASWSDYTSEDAQFYTPSFFSGSFVPAQVAADSYNGYDIVPGDGTANQTDAGNSFNVDMKIVNPDDGIDTFGATADLYFEWKDEAGNWQRHAAPLDSQSVPTGAVDPLNTTSIASFDQGNSYANSSLEYAGTYVELANFSFTGTIPDVGGVIQEARVVADVQAEHDGDLVPDTSITRQNNLDYRVSNYTVSYQVQTYGYTAPQIIEVSNSISDGSTALDFQAAVSVDNPDPSISSFDGSASAFIEYHDGTNWIRMPSALDSDAQVGGDAATPLVFDFDMSLRDIPASAEQVRIVVDFDMTHDGVQQPTETKVISLWDGATVTPQPPTTTTLLSWAEPLANAPETRTAEYASKIEWLDEASGYNRPLRESNLGTSGLNGLYLADKSLSSTTGAQEAVSAIQMAMNKVNSLASYYGAELKRTTNMLDFETILSDVLETGVGNLVDADLAKESAKSQALQVKEQLGLQALGIANRSSELILSLFNK